MKKIYGLRSIIEAIQAEVTIDKIFLQKNSGGPLFRELEVNARSAGIPISYVPADKLKKYAAYNHQGAVAEISPITFKAFEPLMEELLDSVQNPLILILDKITDVRNFGAIIRTAECCGVHAIVVPETGAAPINEHVIKTSAGAAFNIPVTRVSHLLDAIYYLKSSNIQVTAATEKTDQLMYEIDFTGPTALIMGAENTGISPALLKICDHKAKIPLLGTIKSLNVSVACGVLLYEVVRQRH